MTAVPPSTGNPFALGRILGPTTVAVFLAGWLAAFYPFDDLLDRQGTPLGGDYVMFYLGGQIAADGAVSKLYEPAEHCHRLRKLFPHMDEGDLLPYRYPPFVAAAFAPLARLTLAWSFAVFFTFSLTLWIATLLLLRRGWPEFLATSAGQGFWWVHWVGPVALETLAGGQASLVALCIATCGVLLLRTNRPVLAGAVLALALYKPNVLALFLLGVVIRYPRTLLGIIPVAVLLVLGGIAFVGWESTLTYATLGQQLVGNTWQTPTPFWKVHGLASWLDGVAAAKLIVLGFGITLVIAAAFGKLGRNLREPCPSTDDVYLALTLAINSLCNPYLPIYDLTLVLLPLTMLASAYFTHDDRARKSPLPMLIVASYFGPHLSQALAFTTHGQVFTLVLAGLVLYAAVQHWRQSVNSSVGLAETRGIPTHGLLVPPS